MKGYVEAFRGLPCTCQMGQTDNHVRFLQKREDPCISKLMLMALLIQDTSSFYHRPDFIKPPRSHMLVVNSTHGKGLISDIH